jgi:hypothetical protein
MASQYNAHTPKGDAQSVSSQHRHGIILWFFRASTAAVRQGLLTAKASRSHAHTPHSVGLLWTSYQSVAVSVTLLASNPRPCRGDTPRLSSHYLSHCTHWATPVTAYPELPQSLHALSYPSSYFSEVTAFPFRGWRAGEEYYKHHSARARRFASPSARMCQVCEFNWPNAKTQLDSSTKSTGTAILLDAACSTNRCHFLFQSVVILQRHSKATKTNCHVLLGLRTGSWNFRT